MKAMLLDGPGLPLREVELPRPHARAGEVVVRVRACGVCRTDLHVVDGDLSQTGPFPTGSSGRSGSSSRWQT